MEVGIAPGHIVLDGDPAPPPLKKGGGAGSQKNGAQPLPLIFGPYLLWQMAGWIKTPLGQEVGLGPSNSALDGVQLPLPLQLDVCCHSCCGGDICERHEGKAGVVLFAGKTV